MEIVNLAFLYNYQMTRKLTTWQWMYDYKMIDMQWHGIQEWHEND
jgi:hypothetical protein